jgi:hypothetical protein
VNAVEFKLLGDVRILVYKNADGNKVFRVLVENDNVADVGDVVEEMLKLY